MRSLSQLEGMSRLVEFLKVSPIWTLQQQADNLFVLGWAYEASVRVYARVACEQLSVRIPVLKTLRTGTNLLTLMKDLDADLRIHFRMR